MNENSLLWLQNRAKTLEQYCIFRWNDKTKPLSEQILPQNVEIIGQDTVMAHKDTILEGFTRLRDAKLPVNQHHHHYHTCETEIK